jgi:GNAT superfamily N-acetyltransferase
MDVQVRLGNSTDLSRIQSLQEASIKILGAKVYAPQQISALVANQAQSRKLYDEIIVLAEIENQLVGFGCLNQDCSIIQGLFVHPDWARQGIGSLLISRMEGMARECRVDELVVTASLTGVPFYESQGYRTLSKTGFWASQKVWIPCLQMAKPLQAPLQAKVTVPLTNQADAPLMRATPNAAPSSPYDIRTLCWIIGTTLATISCVIVYRTWQQSQPQSWRQKETTITSTQQTRRIFQPQIPIG